MEINKLRLGIRILSILAFCSMILYVFLHNFPLFGIQFRVNEKDISSLTPESRVKTENILGEKINRQTDNVIYFTTKSEGFDYATLEFEFMSSVPDQELHIGYKDRKDWHYFTKAVNLPFLNTINWRRVTLKKPHVYTRHQSRYYSYDTLLKNPPSDAVGIYLNDPGQYDLSIGYRPDYTPSAATTILDTPLRGSHTFYAFLQNEPFKMQITKQDLNWYDGKDPLNVRIYKDGNLLTERELGDDGISDSSKTISEPQNLDLSYEGGNPENGIYQVQITTSGDTLITSISTNLYKLVFEPPLFVLSKNWNQKDSNPIPVNLYTDSKKFEFETYHTESIQNIKINKDTLQLDKHSEKKLYETDTDRNLITLPKGDVYINGQGFFAFSKEQFFTPFLFKRQIIKNSDDLNDVDFFVTDYEKPFNGSGNWKIASVTFDLNNAYYNNGILSWMVRAPGLKENNRELYIRNIRITLHKDSIIKSILEKY